MQKKLVVLKSKYLDSVKKTLFSRLDRVIKDELIEFVELEKKIKEGYNYKIVSIEEMVTVKKHVLACTEGLWDENNPHPFSEFAYKFINEVSSEIESFPKTARLDQKPERFKIQDDDVGIIPFLKMFKRFFWLLSQLPNRIIRKKISHWKHQVPVYHVLRECLIKQMSEKAVSLLVPHYTSLMSAYIDLYRWESANKTPGNIPDKLNLTERLKKETTKNKSALKKLLIAHSEELLLEMENALDRVGTIELSSSNFDAKRIEKDINKVDKEWIEKERGWNNTFDVFLETWRSEITLQMLMLQTSEHLNTFLDNQANNLHEYIGEELDGIDAFIKDKTDLIDSSENELPTILKKCIYEAKKSLDQVLIPALLEKIGNKNLVNGIARLESGLLHDLEELSMERRTSKVPTDYLQPLGDDDITTTSPYDLVAFETIPKLKGNFDKIKSDLINELEQDLQAAQDIDHMIAYGLTASLDEFNTHQDISKATTVALQSLKRSSARVRDIRESLEKCLQEANNSIVQSVESYNSVLDSLTKTENIREMRLRILKAKAVQSAEVYKEEIREKVRKTYQHLLMHAKTQFDFVIQLKHKIFRQFHLHTSEEVNIEVANFLIDSQHLIESLPLIYRNLYQITPVTDQELFVGREKELTELKDAYFHWTNNKKGAVAIIGEKWSGLTSLVNHIQHGDYFNYRTNRYKAKTSDNSFKELLDFFGEIVDVKLKTDSTWSELADVFNQGPKKVIIIEDVHCLYFRRVGGFEMLMGLAELIQSTSANIFWVVTCNLYIWQYFERTLQLDEFFRYHIEFIPPTEDEIEQLILKRNRISGYKPFFKHAESLQQSKKFLNSSEEDQQKILKEKFFRDLIRYSSSNISMALMFYLLSTDEITGDRIEISEFKKPDLTFLSALPMDKVMSLHLLILHDGLTIDQFSELSRMQIQISKLLLGSMYEDGILLKKEGYFMVNPLIYRSVITLLKAKNLL